MRPNVREIAQAAASHYKLPILRLTAPNTSRRYAHPRQIVMYLGRKLAHKSYPEIGRILCRDHSTIVAGFRATEKRLGRPEILSAIITIAAEATRLCREREVRDWALVQNLRAEQVMVEEAAIACFHEAMAA